MSRPKNNKPRSKAARSSSTTKSSAGKSDSDAGKKDAGKKDAGKKDAGKKKAKPAQKSQPAPKGKKQPASAREIEQAKADRRALLKKTGRNFLLVVAAGLVILAVSAWNNRDRDPVSILGEAYEQARAQPVACGATIPDPAESMEFEAPEDLGLTGPVTATIATSCGDLVVQLDPEEAPESVNSFVFLAERGFYEGTVVYSVRPDLAIEAGDQTAMGDEGAGYRIVDEPPGDDFVYNRGTVALAAGGGPNRSDSRFMIVLADDVPLANLNVIGTMTAGDEVLDEIVAIDLGAQITGARTRPLETVYIESVTIVR